MIVTGSDVTPDFLVTLRNFVSTAEGEWKNKALLIVSDNIKDSINGGMKNLNEKGYPFSLDYIIDNLSNDINKSNLSKYDKEILSVYLSNEEEGLYKVTLWDFEYVLSIINKGVIEDSDYEKYPHSLKLKIKKYHVEFDFKYFTEKNLKIEIVENSFSILDRNDTKIDEVSIEILNPFSKEREKKLVKVKYLQIIGNNYKDNLFLVSKIGISEIYIFLWLVESH